MDDKDWPIAEQAAEGLAPLALLRHWFPGHRLMGAALVPSQFAYLGEEVIAFAASDGAGFRAGVMTVTELVGCGTYMAQVGEPEDILWWQYRPVLDRMREARWASGEAWQASTLTALHGRALTEAKAALEARTRSGEVSERVDQAFTIAALLVACAVHEGERPVVPEAAAGEPRVDHTAWMKRSWDEPTMHRC